MRNLKLFWKWGMFILIIFLNFLWYFLVINGRKCFISLKNQWSVFLVFFLFRRIFRVKVIRLKNIIFRKIRIIVSDFELREQMYVVVMVSIFIIGMRLSILFIIIVVNIGLQGILIFLVRKYVFIGFFLFCVLGVVLFMKMLVIKVIKIFENGVFILRVFIRIFYFIV